jgi:hypothetical protein
LKYARTVGGVIYAEVIVGADLLRMAYRPKQISDRLRGERSVARTCLRQAWHQGRARVNETSVELHAPLPSVLDKAFKGEL